MIPETIVEQILRKPYKKWDEVDTMVFRFYGDYQTPEDNKQCDTVTINFDYGIVTYANFPDGDHENPSAQGTVLAKYKIKVELIPQQLDE
jgi:hypothetical protein